MQITITGILAILLLLFVGFWIGKAKPNLLGGFPGGGM
jgi:FtsZ-interacting cell division protein ZipA